MSLRSMTVQYVGDTLYLPPLEREIKHIIVREADVADWIRYEPIVRCRDCRHFTPKGTHKFENGKVNDDYCDYVRGWMLQITPDGFCAWGERRDA